MKMWTRFYCIKRGSNKGFLWIRWWVFGLH